LEKLYSHHRANSPQGFGFHLKDYSNFASQLQGASRRMTQSTWNQNPSVYSAKIISLARWLIWQLNRVELQIQSETDQYKKRTLIESCRKYLQGYKDQSAWVLRHFKPNAPQLNDRLTDEDWQNVDELTTVLRMTSKAFEAKCLALPGEPEFSDSVAKCDPAENLREPILMLNDFARKKPEDPATLAFIVMLQKLDKVLVKINNNKP